MVLLRFPLVMAIETGVAVDIGRVAGAAGTGAAMPGGEGVRQVKVGRGPGSGVMAGIAGCAKSALVPGRIRMAARAVGWRSFEAVVGMAAGAVGPCMSAGKGKPGYVMVE